MTEIERQPHDLGDLLEHLLHDRDNRRTTRPETHGDISNLGVARLVKLAYLTSLTTEEGAYPQFRLFVTGKGSIDPKVAERANLMRFQSSIQLDHVEDLQRLAPSVSSHEFALEVQESVSTEGEFVINCTGVRQAYSDHYPTELFSPTPWANAVPSGMMIRVDAPGCIRVTENHRVHLLHPGKLVVMGNVPIGPPQVWQDQLAKKFSTDEEVIRGLIHIVSFGWNEVLRVAAEGQRGGCFVVLPVDGITPDDVETDFGIRVKFPTVGPDLGRAMCEFVNACNSPDIGVGNKLEARAKVWTRTRTKLMSMVRCLSQVSGIDGCTVLTRDLRMLGFGGKIDVSFPNHKKEFRDFGKEHILDVASLKKVGTRHQSAFSLCEVHDSAHCYVVSQDGDVTLFWSDRSTVFRWKPYWPWSNSSDRS